jgi:hypothetical protein
MALITISSFGTLSASASSVWPDSDSDTDELTLPEGYAFYLASIRPTWSIWYITAPYLGSANWSVGPVTSYSRTIRLTVNTHYEATADVTAEVFGYSIDQAARWGMQSPTLMRRFKALGGP